MITSGWANMPEAPVAQGRRGGNATARAHGWGGVDGDTPALAVGLVCNATDYRERERSFRRLET